MRFVMRRCVPCGRYTLREGCPKCGGETRSAHPARFSPDDRYMRYRLAERYGEGQDPASGSSSGGPSGASPGSSPPPEAASMKGIDEIGTRTGSGSGGA